MSGKYIFWWLQRIGLNIYKPVTYNISLIMK